LAGYLFITPTVLFIGTFQLWPLVRGVYLSMTTSGYFGGSTFTGLENFTRLVHDPEFLHAAGNSVKYTLIVLLGIPVAMAVAAMLNTPRLRGGTTFRVLFFLPVVVMPTALGLSWSTLLNGSYGPLNSLLEVFGIAGRSWLQDPVYALVWVGVVGVWSSLGYNIVLFLAGLQAIPRDLYEAAAIDGAGRVRQFFRITVPLLSPTTFFLVVTGVLQAMQMFDLLYVMIGSNAGGGVQNPAINDAETVVYLFYETGFVNNDRRICERYRGGAARRHHAHDPRAVPTAEAVGGVCLTPRWSRTPRRRGRSKSSWCGIRAHGGPVCVAGHHLAEDADGVAAAAADSGP
jgi:multiple sugar transport system permease protein